MISFIIRVIAYAVGGLISASTFAGAETATAIFIGMVAGDICASTSRWNKS